MGSILINTNNYEYLFADSSISYSQHIDKWNQGVRTPVNIKNFKIPIEKTDDLIIEMKDEV